jgi:hypothetical protein
MRIRIASALFVAAATSLLLTGPAWACQQAHLTFSPSAGPGDTVSFSISSIEPGATYSIVLEGHEVASGVNDTSYNGVSGTFTMPDLGSQPQTAFGAGHTVHADDGDTQDPNASLQYDPPVSPPSSTPQISAPAPTPTAVARHRAHRIRPQSPIAVAQQTAKKQKQDSPSTGSAAGSAPSNSIGSEPGPSDPSSGAGAAKAHESSSVPRRVMDALGSSTEVGPAKVPTMGLLLMALIFIAGTALAAFVIYLSQTGPDPEAAIKAPAPVPLDPVEAELQEMIGTEMARQLLSDLELGEQLPVGPPS